MINVWESGQNTLNCNDLTRAIPAIWLIHLYQVHFFGYTSIELMKFQIISLKVTSGRSLFLFSFLLLSVSSIYNVFAQSGQQNSVEDNIDWPSFLNRHDLVWKLPPTAADDAGMLGNGFLGMNVFKELATTEHPSKDKKISSSDKVIRFAVDRRDVYDRRDLSWGWTSYSRPRIHVGDFQLHTEGQITGFNMRLDLYNAELRGNIQTNKGEIRFRAFVHATMQVMVIELEPTGGENQLKWTFRPYEAITTRKDFPPRADYFPGNEEGVKRYYSNYGTEVNTYVPNPQPVVKTEGEFNLCIQELLTGGGYTTAWQKVDHQSGKQTVYISIAMSHPELTSPSQAKNSIRKARETGIDKLVSTHREWWHNFYPCSFVSLPDTKIESYYWIQMYKMGCVTRPDAGMIDAHFWYQPTFWNYLTHNDGTHLRHYPLLPTNHLDLGESLLNSLDNHKAQLRLNVRPVEYQEDSYFLGHCSQMDLISPLDMDMRYEREWGNLLWYLHNYWLHYRYIMDDELLRQRLFPLLRGAVNFYLHHIEEGTDGKLHLPWTYSPEYVNAWNSFPRPEEKKYSPEYGLSRDTNYDLALLKWACISLIQACERLNMEDPLLVKWTDIRERLVDFPADENGYMVGRDIPYIWNRHYSHLFMIYPLYLINWDQDENREIIDRSLRRQYGKLGTGIGPASLATSIGRGNRALEYLMDRISGNQNVRSNNIIDIQPITEMLIQSWGQKIRVFPAMPDAWQNAVFHNLRAEGAFLVSAVRRDGKTDFIRIKSLAGEPCILKTDLTGPLEIASQRKMDYKTINEGEFQIYLNKGEEVTIYTSGKRPGMIIEPLPAQPGRSNYFGLNY